MKNSVYLDNPVKKISNLIALSKEKEAGRNGKKPMFAAQTVDTSSRAGACGCCTECGTSQGCC